MPSRGLCEMCYYLSMIGKLFSPVRILTVVTAVFLLVTASTLSVKAASYSLSFSSDPISAFWPTPTNHVQQMEAFLWRDSDYSSLKQLEGLTTQWTVDPAFITITATGSSYFDSCPQVRKDLPCIMFYAQIVTSKSGRSDVNLRILQNGQELVWNAYPIVIKDIGAVSSIPPQLLKQSPPQTVTPKASPVANLVPEISPSPLPTGQPRDYDQEIKYLKEQLSEQQRQIDENRNLLQRILDFLKRIFSF